MEKVSELPLWMKWKRPASVPYPNTWNRFTTTLKDGKILNIKIIDLTPDRFEESMEFMENYFYQYEPVTLCLKFVEDEVSYHNDLCIQRTVLQQNMSIISVLDEDVPKPEIVGLLKLVVHSKDDEPVPNVRLLSTHPNIQVPGILIQKKIELISHLKKNYDPFEMFGTDKLIKDFGLCVKSEYRGMSIGYNLVATIEKVARAFDIKVSTMGRNSIQSQIIAEKVGYKLIKEIVYSEYKDEQGRVMYPVEGTKCLKLMANEYL